VVTAPDEWATAIAAAQREARAAFGDDTLLIERYVERPRHIEVQVLADAYGNVVHLGERECSLQRRHQKVIEEAPSPYLDDAQRAALGEQAVAAAAACGYVNAGTVEFVVSGERPDEAYFLEMNTRLQVEHPVTEMVWGLDLVEQQLRIAAGEPLAFTQAELAPRGHAFEARVYAEDPAAGFLPTGGTVVLLDEPTGREHVRVDSALVAGAVVGSDYDPMLAKVIAWGADRDVARRRLVEALADTTVLGVTTNVAFLGDLLGDPDVVAGVIDTGLIDRRAAAAPAVTTPPAVAVAAALTLLAGSAQSGPWGDRRGWRLSEPATIGVRLVERGERVDVRLRATGPDDWRASVGEWDGTARATLHRSRVRLAVDGVSSEYAVARAADGVWLGRGGAAWHFTPAPAHGPGRDAVAGAGLTILSPMPGTVVSVDVAVGDTVAAGQAVAVVEAMKMEHTLRATEAAVVREVAAAAGDKVALHQKLVILESTVLESTDG
jgi:acetyl-CoA/propionyl-CoA carboxylase biotin carboxyl carrier protein